MIEDLTLDFYGAKTRFKNQIRYLLSSWLCDYRIIKSLDFEMRPH